ncbi:MAG: Na+/H+ antiporter [Candidatus Eremiobacteraeota bacterium]|nr:Na+/H+ antiporter [Candidatus Eremiobacteraeota bacterium]
MSGVLLVSILAAIVALALLAKRLHVPYPVVFVAGGIVLALIPGVPTIELRPDLVFLLFLPALIFGDGWTTDYHWFKRFYQPIFMLAIGLVAFTSLIVAYAAHWLMGFPLALGFVLGAILSPTDAVATDAIAEEVSLPRTLMTIISGESLVNDATGLVIYRFAVIAVATGAFSLLAAALQFAYVVIVGVAVGLAIAWLIAKVSVAIRKAGLGDELISVSISLVTPFALYVPADAIGASGVLAAMAGGIYLSRKSTQIFDADARLAAAYTWNLLFFVFNGAAFVLIGLQLRSIVRTLQPYSLATVIGWALAIALLVIVVRVAWMFPAAYGRRKLWPKIREREGPDPPWQSVLVLSLAGMRGIVSLAAALALPETIAPGVPFPQRNLILFVTFVVIVVTLVGEGLALPWIIRRLGVHGADDEGKALAAARVQLADAVRAHLRSLEPSFASPAEWEIAGRLHAHYELQAAHFTAHADGAEPDDDAQQHAIEGRLRREAFEAQQRALQELRRAGALTDDLFRQLQWDLDLAESQLE